MGEENQQIIDNSRFDSNFMFEVVVHCNGL